MGKNRLEKTPYLGTFHIVRVCPCSYTFSGAKGKFVEKRRNTDPLMIVRLVH